MASAHPLEVTLYTRPGCHLCEEAKALLGLLLREFEATIREVNIDDDRTLLDRYTNDVPVVFLGARKIAEHRVDAAELRRALEQAKN